MYKKPLFYRSVSFWDKNKNTGELDSNPRIPAHTTFWILKWNSCITSRLLVFFGHEECLRFLFIFLHKENIFKEGLWNPADV